MPGPRLEPLPAAWKDLGLTSSPTVLVVDPLEVTGEVLRTALLPLGVRVLSTSLADQGLALARTHSPDLVVLDFEAQPSRAIDSTEQLVCESRRCARPLIVLGKWRRPAGEATPGSVLAKPYHYGALIRKISEVLAQARPAA